jgi:predicted short-subunit dehydrogenase-like oxidoreductase (DUF2520 family)
MSDLAVIGRGRVGVALAEAFAHASLNVELHAARTLPATLSAPTYLLCVRDPQLGDVARAVLTLHRGAPPTILHTAGGVPSAILRDAGAPAAAMLHPLVSFAGTAPTLRGALFAIEGDARGLAQARSLADRLGGRIVELSEAQLPTYHAAAALSANHVLGLVSIGQQLLVELGVEPALALRGLSALFCGVATNLEAFGLPDALTGPIARGDVEAVERHLVGLASRPAALAAYIATAPALIALARLRGTADPSHLNAIAARLPLYAPTNLE